MLILFCYLGETKVNNQKKNLTAFNDRV